MTGPANRLSRAAAALLLAIAVAGAPGGCARERDDKAAPAAEGPPPISEAEATRARDACAGYREKVCALADDDPAHEAGCRMAETRLQALDMHLDVLGGAMPDRDRRALQAEARKVVKGCLEDLARL
jgi:hypothetical protein